MINLQQKDGTTNFRKVQTPVTPDYSTNQCQEEWNPSFRPRAAEFPTILRNVGIWVRKLRILSFLTNFKMGN